MILLIVLCGFAGIQFIRPHIDNPPVNPAGALLSLITWKQQPDDHWFGAIIPGAVESVEQVLYTAGSISPLYTKYAGNKLTKSPGNPEGNQRRIDWMIQQRASVMP